MSILDKLKKSSRTQGSDLLCDSEMFKGAKPIKTPVPMINVALGGSVDSGLKSGLMVLAGPSKHFKTSFGLLMTAAYMKANPKSALLFYDSEFGSPQDYFESFGIDPSRVFHTPVTNIEELKFDLVHQLTELSRKDEVIIMIDSIGNIASKKELEDTESQKSVQDMTRAKQLKGLFRMVTPLLTTKDIPLIAINHTYKEQGMFPKDIVSGGTGIYYSANDIWILGRQQDKKGTEIQGYHFIINIEKSRFVKEKSKIPISVSWDGGIEKYSGLLPVAEELGYVIKPKMGWYVAYDPATKTELTGNLRAAQTMTAEFWDNLLAKTDFGDAIIKKFRMPKGQMIGEDKQQEVAEND